MIDGVVGVIIWTQDVKGLVAFYRDTLGLKPHSVRPNFVAFQSGQVRLSVGRHSRVQGPARDPYRIMVNLGTHDINRLAAELQAKGVRFDRLPEQEHWGGYVATFRDPDGNLLQLLQLPEEGPSQQQGEG